MAQAIQNAARTLRGRLKMSQQAMATRLNLSMAALRNYESGATESPDPRPLYAYMMEAEKSEEKELAATFRHALYESLNMPDNWRGLLPIEPRDDFEKILV